MDLEIYDLAEQLGNILTPMGKSLAIAESCTGGGICSAITAVPGSSVWFDRGFITYSNSAKKQMLGVSQRTLNQYGAVSSEVAKEMTIGVLAHSEAELAVAVTGIAGPGGGTIEKPVGLVFIGCQLKSEKPIIQKYLFSGTRHQIQNSSIREALKICIKNSHY